MLSHIGQKLTAVDKRTRDKSLKVVANWISKKKDLTEEQLMKLWKALFYSYWMSDKPAIQFELADNLASLVHRFPKNNLLYLKTFYLTLKREWGVWTVLEWISFII
eukprot:TRINITY_DN1391_c0_g1_i1.p1 TRINITY_DN1391_c0_g1~~TRINITY_DN1391_c0_g1_i1.p1  ORF type:complete len:106 (-),score=19.84 TRINITY_DN1391_c0_g1_i1:227-544(-)